MIKFDNMTVILDGKAVGEIRKVDGGYAYFPDAGRDGLCGETFPTIEQVKKDVRGDDQ